MRYNPPPNWPQPPSGWTPPPGWEPDPDWGPPPQGWSLWAPEDGPGAGGGYGGYQGGGYQGGGYQGGAVPGPPPSSSGGSTTKIVLALVGVVALVVLVGGGFLLFRDRSDSSDSTPASGNSTAGSAAASDGPPSCPSDGGAKRDPKALGAGATIGDFCATIYRVVPDDTAAIVAARSTNTPPTKGQYVLVDVAATYNGSATAATSFELYVYLEGGDGVEYPDTECDVVTEDDLSLEPESSPGQTAKGGFCLDVPAAALNGGVLRMESSSSADATYWKLN